MSLSHRPPLTSGSLVVAAATLIAAAAAAMSLLREPLSETNLLAAATRSAVAFQK